MPQREWHHTRCVHNNVNPSSLRFVRGPSDSTPPIVCAKAGVTIAITIRTLRMAHFVYAILELQ